MNQFNKGWIFLSTINHLASVIGTVVCLYVAFQVTNLLGVVCTILLLIYNVMGSFLWLYEVYSHSHRKYQQLSRLYKDIGKLCNSKLLANIILISITSCALFIKTILPLLLI